MNEFSPVKISAFKSMDKCFCSSDIGCNGDIMNIAKAEKGCIVRIGVLVHGIAEEKEKVDFVAGDTGSNLFTAAMRTAEES